jgi:hypothetical protein
MTLMPTVRRKAMANTIATLLSFFTSITMFLLLTYGAKTSDATNIINELPASHNATSQIVNEDKTSVN